MQLQGIAASSGIALAKAIVIQNMTSEIVENHHIHVDDELNRLDEAFRESIIELQELYEVAKGKLGESHAQIFTAHTLILQDPEFVGSIKNTIRDECVNAEFSLQKTTDMFVAIFHNLENDYMVQRSADIKDVSQRVLGHLQGNKNSINQKFQEPVILVAHDLAPSDTIRLDKNFVKGFITDIGGQTSHTAIMARSLGIPAVVGIRNATEEITTGSQVVVNGFEGTVIVSPSDDDLITYNILEVKYANEQKELQELVHSESKTLDGHIVELGANIGTQNDLSQVLAFGAEGIGLFRTEFLFMNRTQMPSEEEQFEAYKAVIQGMSLRPVIIRTLDVGGDKKIPYLGLPDETNPFLGYRAIRFCLDKKEFFKQQLRAILRASHFGKTRVMFPMISNITELRKAKSILAEVQAELDMKNIPYSNKLEIGIMVEIPASAIAADILVKEVDFFSIGTNDLIQYTMACDRMNEHVSSLYQPCHPAVLRLIKMVIDAAHKEGKWVGMCGEMAGDITAVPILVGLGLDEFSMSAGSILPVRKLIRNLSFEKMKVLADKAIYQESQEAVRDLFALQINEI